MKTEYIVFFEVYGKKLKTRVEADDEDEAKAIVKSSINIVKVKQELPYREPKGYDDRDLLDDFNEAFGEIMDLFKKKKNGT